MIWFKRMNKKNLISTLVSIALLVVFSIAIEGTVTLSGIFSLIFIYAIAALALNIICGCLGEFVLGHGGFVLIGYTIAVKIMQFVQSKMDPTFFFENVFTVRGGTLHPLGYLIIIGIVIIAAILTGLIGLLVGTIALGRLKGDYLAIVTLGISLIFVSICKNFDSLGGGPGISLGTAIKGKTILYAVFLVVVLFLILTFMKSRFGRAILACRDDNIAAEACGVAVNKSKVLAFTFATFLTGIAGGLLAFNSLAIPEQYGLTKSIFFLIIIVLGGLGSLTGTIIATCVMVFYEQWFCYQAWVPTFFQNNPKIIYGVILVLIMLFRSSGILGHNEFTWKWFYSKLKIVWEKIESLFKKKTPKEVE